MAPPGSLEARYERLAGPEERRLELYVARTKLGYTIDEWRALPWWQRRVYLEGMEAEYERIEQARSEASGAPGGGSDPAEAILGGTMSDVAATGYGAG